MKYIDPKKKQKRHTESISHISTKIVIRKPSSEKKKYTYYKYARHYLCLECKEKKIFCFPVFFCDDIFRKEVVQALSHSEIIVT